MDSARTFARPRRLRFGALLAALLAAAPLPAAAGETVAMRFDVSIAGTRAFELDYRLELDAGGYASAVSLESRGVIALFSAIELDMEGAGRFAGQGLVPATFQMGSSRKGKDKLANVTWSPGKMPAARRSYPLPAEREAAIREALAADMPDPLTALLKVAVLAAETPCAGTERVFNGAEVYDLRFELQKPDSFGAEDGGVYRGPAFKCSLTYVPVAGLEPKKAQKRLKEPPRFDMWFAPVLTRSRGTVFVPVAAAGSVKGATFIALSSRASLDGAPLNAQSLASQ